jgi:hypothetical protein
MTKSLTNQVKIEEKDNDDNYDFPQQIGTYDPDHPRFGDFIKGRIGFIDYVVLKAQGLFVRD